MTKQYIQYVSNSFSHPNLSLGVRLPRFTTIFMAGLRLWQFPKVYQISELIHFQQLYFGAVTDYWGNDLQLYHFLMEGKGVKSDDFYLPTPLHFMLSFPFSSSSCSLCSPCHPCYLDSPCSPQSQCSSCDSFPSSKQQFL